MGSYLQQYGVKDERRNRIVKWIAIAGATLLVLSAAGYSILHNSAEKRVVTSFLRQVNSRDYQSAYRSFGCTEQHPCPNYDFRRFMSDWGPASKASAPWKIDSVDGCMSFVTVNVDAVGVELQSLAVQRNDHSLGFAPAGECQEKEWRWGQFFHRVFGGESKDAAKNGGAAR